MNYLGFSDYIKKKSLKNIYLFVGDEDYLREYCAGIIKSKVMTDKSFDTHRIEGKKTLEALSDAVLNMPLFNVNKFIEISESGLFALKKNDPQTKELLDMLSDLDENIYMVFKEKEKVDKPEKNLIYQMIKKNGVIVECSLQNDQELVKGIHKRFVREGYKIGTESVKRLVEFSDRRMNSLTNEIDKIIAFKGEDRTITLEDIDKLATRSITIKIFNLLDAISLKRKGEAIVMLDEMIQLKEPEQKILFLITKNFIDMLKITQLKKKGQTNQQIMKKINERFEFVIKKQIGFSRRFTEKDMIRIIKCCVKADRKIKEGILAPRLSLEILISEIVA